MHSKEILPHPQNQFMMLQELEGFTYATAHDLNMGYCTIRLDPAASKMCTIHLSLGKVLLQEIAAHGLWRLSQYIPSPNDGPDCENM